MNGRRPELRIVRDPDQAPALPVPAGDAAPDQPARPGRGPAEPRIYEGEILPRAPQRQPVRTLRIVQLTPPRRARRAAGIAVTIGRGVGSYAGRAWDAATFGVYRRQIRIAEATGDREALADWTERLERAVAARRARMMELPVLAINLVKGGLIGCAAALAGLIALSTTVWLLGLGEWITTWHVVGNVIRFLLGVVIYGWPAILIGTVAYLLRAAWREGRRTSDADAPGRMQTGGDAPEARDIIPDENAILNALRHLGISELNKAFKAGWTPRVVLPTQREGKGYRTQIVLPPGVPVEKIVEKKTVLAHNLVRFPVEVWPTEPRDNPGVLDLWVADQGALSGPVPPWPLLHEGSADYFKGVPVAVNIRGKSITGRLFEANYAIAGMMGSGKSSLIITLLLGALLDPLVEADVFVLADNADYDPMKPRLRTLMTGSGQEVIEACMDTMSDLYAELTVRGQALKEHGVRAASRQLAEIDQRLRPRVLVIDECQALYLDAKYGEKATDVSVKLQSAARKYGITIIRATPEPSSDSLPRRLTAVTSNRACFAIGDQHANDAILGTGSYKAGVSAVGLEPRTEEGPGDVGTFMARGFEPKPGLLRAYFVNQEQAASVVERAMEIRRKAGITGRAAPQARDLLDDLAEVLATTPDGERVRVADLPGMLRRLAPTWLPYQSLTGTELREVLTKQHGVRVTNTGNVPRLDPAHLRACLARRNAERAG